MKDLFETYAPRVYLFALRLARNREAAEDLTQEVFVQALRHRDGLRDPAAARAWLFTVTVNLWRSRLRRQNRDEQFARHAEQAGPRYAPLPEQEIIAREDMRRVREAMDGLPARQREVLHLHACEGMSLAEIAGVLQISPDAVKASLSLARKRMRKELHDLDGARLPTS